MFKKLLLILVINCLAINAQKIELKGDVYDEYLIPFYKAKINAGGVTTTTDDNGIFKLKTELPVTITVDAEGYQSESIYIKNKDEKISLILKASSKLDEVIVSASRTSERIFESPVSVERLGLNDIKNGTSLNFYEEMVNLRGVDVNNNSFNLKSVNTRGFSTLRNVRFVQLIDGVDNHYPGSSMPFGNLSGISGLDVESVEVLPGAASALYGANAFNGLLLINSKSPFEYTGISAELKGGVTNQEGFGAKGFYHPSIRLAYKFTDHFAAKATFSYITGEDWHANDFRNINNFDDDFKNSENISNYNAVNRYGDETGVNLKSLAYIAYLRGLLSNEDIIKTPNETVNRTGYDESFLRENDKYLSKRLGVSLHYKPWANDNLEVIWTSRFNSSNYMIQAPPSRYEQKEDKFNSHMLELKGSNFFLRGYYNDTDGGDSHNLRILGNYIDKKTSDDSTWLEKYRQVLISTGSKKKAREFADLGRAIPGSSLFNKIQKEAKNKLLGEGGSKLIDQAAYYHADWNYDFSKHLKAVSIQLGGSFREYILGTTEEGRGSLFTDYTESLKPIEWGIYMQAKKKLVEDRLHLLGSIRYDKAENFKANISPRVSVTYTAGKNKNHSFRGAFQTAFRNPTMQDQYFGLKVSNNAYLIGNIKENRDRFEKQTGIDLNKTGFTESSFSTYFNNLFNNLDNSDGSTEIAENVAKYGNLLKTFSFKDYQLKNEKLTSFELGYRGITTINNRIFEIDLNGYYNMYKDFITEETVLIPKQGDVEAKRLTGAIDPAEIVNNPFALALMSITMGNSDAIIMPINSDASINSYGLGISLKTKVAHDFKIGLNYTYSDYTFDEEKNPDFEPSFNTPNHNIKLSIGNEKLTKNLGFAFSARWQSSFYWQSPFVDGEVDARTMVDGQVSYKVPSMKSVFKIGGTNLLGKNYHTTIGSGEIGSVYYLSWIINN